MNWSRGKRTEKRIGRRKLERTGNELGGGGWSELKMNGEAGVGANWE